MQRYREFAARLLSGLDDWDVHPIVQGLDDDALVAVLAGAPDTRAYVRDVVAAELRNRLAAKAALLEVSIPPLRDGALALLTEALRRALRADMSCVDQTDGGHFILRGKNRLPPELDRVQRCRHVSMSLCEGVLRTQEPLVLPDIGADSRYMTVPALTKFGIRSYAGAPCFSFTRNRELVGVVWVAGYAPRPFLDSELRLLGNVADRVAVELAAERAHC